MVTSSPFLFLPVRCTKAMPALTRSRIILRSNSAMPDMNTRIKWFPYRLHATSWTRDDSARSEGVSVRP